MSMINRVGGIFSGKGPQNISKPSLSNKQASLFAILGGIVATIAALFIPMSVLEGMTGATGLSELIPATAAPLGSSARIIFVIFTGVLVASILLVILLRKVSSQKEEEYDDQGYQGDSIETQDIHDVLNEDSDNAIRNEPAMEPVAYTRKRMPITNMSDIDEAEVTQKDSKLAGIGGVFVGIMVAAKSKLNKLPFIGKDDNAIRDFDDLPKLRESDRHPDAPARRPISAHEELGEKLPDLPAHSDTYNIDDSLDLENSEDIDNEEDADNIALYPESMEEMDTDEERVENVISEAETKTAAFSSRTDSSSAVSAPNFDQLPSSSVEDTEVQSDETDIQIDDAEVQADKDIIETLEDDTQDANSSEDNDFQEDNASSITEEQQPDLESLVDKLSEVIARRKALKASLAAQELVYQQQLENRLESVKGPAIDSADDYEEDFPVTSEPLTSEEAMSKSTDFIVEDNISENNIDEVEEIVLEDNVNEDDVSLGTDPKFERPDSITNMAEVNPSEVNDIESIEAPQMESTEAEMVQPETISTMSVSEISAEGENLAPINDEVDVTSAPNLVEVTGKKPKSKSQKAEMDAALKAALDTLHKMTERSA